MRRAVLFFLALSLVLSLGAVSLAAQEPLSVTDSQVSAGQTVYLAVSLSGPVRADTVGIKCEFDKTLLTALPELSAWENTGLLSAFEQDNMGAWTVQDALELEGRLCVLAFQVKQDAAFSQTAVHCTVVLQEGTQEITSYQADGLLTCACDHRYGDWQSAGALGHERVCSLCGGKNTQSHDWDQGTEKPSGDGVIRIIRTCRVCREQNTVEVPAGMEQDQSTRPSDQTAEPTFPGSTGHTGQTGQPEQEHSHGSEENSQGQITGIPDHTNAAEEESPEHDHVHTDGEASDEDGHEHTHTAVGGTDPVTVWVILGVLAAAITGAVLFLKKKR